MFLQCIDFSLLTKCLCGQMKCLHEPVGMALRAGFDLLAVVWRPLIYSILFCFFIRNWAQVTNLVLIHTASYKTSKIKL